MPSWVIHDKWAKKMGISERISREINELIDFPHRWFSRRKDRSNHESIAEISVKLFIKDQKHDIGGGCKFYKRYFVLKFIDEVFGYEGVEAAILHYALDYIADYLRFYLFKIDNTMLIERLKHKFRDLLKYYQNDIELKPFAKISEEVFKFIEQNISEIREDITNEIKEKMNISSD